VCIPPREDRVVQTRELTGSMFRGITPPLVGVTPIFAISFWVSSLRLSLSVQELMNRDTIWESDLSMLLRVIEEIRH
jgi:hypothetical protein